MFNHTGGVTLPVWIACLDEAHVISPRLLHLTGGHSPPLQPRYILPETTGAHFILILYP